MRWIWFSRRRRTVTGRGRRGETIRKSGLSGSGRPVGMYGPESFSGERLLLCRRRSHDLHAQLWWIALNFHPKTWTLPEETAEMKWLCAIFPRRAKLDKECVLSYFFARISPHLYLLIAPRENESYWQMESRWRSVASSRERGGSNLSLSGVFRQRGLSQVSFFTVSSFWRSPLKNADINQCLLNWRFPIFPRDPYQETQIHCLLAGRPRWGSSGCVCYGANEFDPAQSN